jgi:hypothetical protein
LLAHSEKCRQLFFQALLEMPLITITGTFEHAAKSDCRHFLQMPRNPFAGTFPEMPQNLFTGTFSEMLYKNFTGTFRRCLQILF